MQRTACTALVVILATAARADITPHAGMLRYPDVSATHIVFSYANDLWLAPRDGGMAVPLASPPGQELFPRFSPDGKTIAFVGNYDGNQDLYTVSVNGGVPMRVTHHPATETLCDWTPDGRLLFSSTGLSSMGRVTELLTVSAAGGMPEKLPVPYGANAGISPDGVWLAYTPHSHDHRTWKRYRGGMATDIWLFNLRDKSSRKITDFDGTDSQPMWHGQTVYYMSDGGPEHRLNIWAYDTANGQRRQVTSFKEYDVKWPAIGPGPDGKGEIVLQNGSKIYLVNCATGQAKPMSITIPGARPTIRPQNVDAGETIAHRDISATGKRAVVVARGDIWTLPAKTGSARNLTRTSGVYEREPTWSPDGKTIAYFSDATGEYELYLMAADGSGSPRQLTNNSRTFYENTNWSPDSTHITFGDKAGNLYLCRVETGETRKFDTEPWGSQPRLNWSSDSNWIAYTAGGENQNSAIWIYNVAENKKHQVTSGMFNDTLPTFDRKGEFLYFASNRAWSDPIYEDIGTTFVYTNTDLLLAVPLKADARSPWAPKSDEEGESDKKDEKKEDDKGDGKKNGEEKKDDEKKNGNDKSNEKPDEESGKKDEKKKPDPVVIDLDGFERRALPSPLKRGAYTNLAVTADGKLVYSRRQAGGEEPSIYYFDPKDDEKKEKTVVEGTGNFSISADGEKLLVVKRGTMAIVDAKPDQKLDKPIETKGLHVLLDPPTEWKQLLREAWRLQRDYFYEPTMHNVDWPAVYEQYAAMLPDCVCRDDVTFLIQEMISELNVGHAYYRVQSPDQGPRLSVGSLGCDFELAHGAYRISKIYEGGPWDSDARGPLSQPGVNVKEGDYLLAVNGATIDAAKDPWAALQGLAEKTITITVSDKPALDDTARKIVVETLSNEDNLRYRAWIERNRAYVADKTGGKVGYIHVPDTGVNGQNNLFRQFYGQKHLGALIIDERWNGGGQIPTRFIELLNRPVTNYWARRDGKDWLWPPDSHQGPKCMLINGLSGSGGDAFPYYFRQRGLGKLIGTRTWGGLVGISGNPGLIDGTSVTAPTFGFYELDGTWGVEGHGVDPDIEVIDDPAKMQNGADPQLDAAIKLMLDEMQARPYVPPKRPGSPDRKGMGLAKEDY